MRFRRARIAVALLVLAASACRGAPASDPPAESAETPQVDLSVLDEAVATADQRLRQVDRDILIDRITTLRGETSVPGDLEHFWTDCLQGLMNACESLGDAYRTGIGVAAEPETARLFYAMTVNLTEIYCDAGPETVHGCSQLGRMYHQGLGVTRNETRGVDLLQRGCAGGDDLACLYLDNVGLPSSEPQSPGT